MNLTAFHAKYFACELTKRSPSDNIQKLASSLANSQVDLNPHQIDAALFAFRSPLSKGAILADEVGLGKTIEAGILLAQKWAERRRRLLIIVPANLRRQWQQELRDKFFLPSIIFESKSYKDAEKAGNPNPFDNVKIVICSYHFAWMKENRIVDVPWDLVVIDEAHRLRNVYRPSNRIANAIKNAVEHVPKILLTATPLQNSLHELYGLVSVVDPLIFGDLRSFRAQCQNLNSEHCATMLKERLAPVCQRTLRRQVLEYIKYTNRIPITQEYILSEEEQELYDRVSNYLQTELLYAMPAGRQFMTLIIRKLLASSSWAIAGTLENMAHRLETAASENNRSVVKKAKPGDVAPDFELMEELEDEWEGDEKEKEEPPFYSADELINVKKECQSLRSFAHLARSITKDSKGEVLLAALDRGFAKARELGAPEKAIIFTESLRTQEYLIMLLEKSSYAGKVACFNGSNSDKRSREILKAWLLNHKDSDRATGTPSADMREALVDYFREEAVIMVATEAAAEGINLQFCSLVVNYDLPWNPQRIEQRIGRCHRYGQKYDVVVVNFLNKNNAVEQRIYDLLSEKFKLFSGIFGASDEVLGSIESGVDFERRIAGIYQNCRTRAEIDKSFNGLQHDLENEIGNKLIQTRQKLLDNFDEEVQEKLRVGKHNTLEALERYDRWLWSITRYALDDHAEFDPDGQGFLLHNNPFPDDPNPIGFYRAGKLPEHGHHYRTGHPLAQAIIEHCKNAETGNAELLLDFTRSKRNIAVVEALRGQTGWMLAAILTVTAFETEDYLFLVGIDQNQQPLDEDQCQRLFSLEGKVFPFPTVGYAPQVPHALIDVYEHQRQEILGGIADKNNAFMAIETKKIDRWIQDQRDSLILKVRDMVEKVAQLTKRIRETHDYQAKGVIQEEKRMLQGKIKETQRSTYHLEPTLARRRVELLTGLGKRLKQKIEERQLFILRWRVL